MITRRKFLQTTALVAAAMTWSENPFLRQARAAAFASGIGPLSDPARQPKFVEAAPNALDPGFLFKDLNADGKPAHKPNFSLRLRETVQRTGLIDPRSRRKLSTKVWGYGNETVSWPGQTFQVVSESAGGRPETVVRWENELQGKQHLLPVDTSLHWCYSLAGHNSANGVDYRQYSIRKNGVPIITHLHGGNSDFQFDGNPEFFYSPDGTVKGPQWDFVEGGFTNTFRYNNAVPAGNLWYHDHALGITRLNVYAGLAGFYFVRDELDTGLPDNPLGLPAFPYELAYAVQDRMFTAKGALFYPAFPDDPFYDDFITGEGAVLPHELFPDGGPTVLAEFFGDHMVVNGKIWPKTDVEPRHYRIRLLNGCDSRFMVIQFRAVPMGATDLTLAGEPIPFHVVGSDQGLASEARQTDTLVFEPGGRYDIVFDFSDAALIGKRIVMSNIGGDAPFGGNFGEALPSENLFPDRQTDRIMAFDVVLPFDYGVPDAFDPSAIGQFSGNDNPVSRTRKVALFEGMDEYGRLQPLLGTAEPTVDAHGATVNGALPWHAPTTEDPTRGDTEIWEIYNATADAHPIHLHLVNFEILGRQKFTARLTEQPLVEHNGSLGTGYRLENIVLRAPVPAMTEYVENAPKDMVTTLPLQVTRIKATFNKSGQYVWHCHILSHEDHEMMRILQVG